MSSQIVWRTFHQAGRDQILQAEVDLPLQQFQSHFLITCCRGRDPAIDRKKKLVYFDEKRSDFTKKTHVCASELYYYYISSKIHFYHKRCLQAVEVVVCYFCKCTVITRVLHSQPPAEPCCTKPDWKLASGNHLQWKTRNIS